MKFTDIFIKRPILSITVSLLILVIGIGSLLTLQLRQFPSITNTTISITTIYPGASADTVKSFITNKIERAVGSVDGIDFISSSSSKAVSTVNIFLKMDWPPEKAVTDISQKISAIKGELPVQAESSQIAQKSSDDSPVLYIGFTSDNMTREQITAFLENEFTPKMFSYNGVADVNIMGSMPYAMRVWLNPQKMAKIGISPEEVSMALTANNQISSSGKLSSKYIDVNINANTSLSSVKDFERLVIQNKDGNIIRLSDVATVKLSSENENLFDIKMLNTETSQWQDGVMASVSVTSDANSLEVVTDIMNNIGEIKAILPPNLNMDIDYDATTYIQVSIDEVIHTLVEALIIVMIVMLLFLGSFEAVFVPIITIPLSLIGVFFCMSLMGFSINLLTLLSLVLAIGLVVDDAIVVLENIYRHVEDGKTPFQASIIGAREIQGPVILMTLTLAAVYAPIGMVTGLTGALFTEFAYTLAAAVIISGVIALTLTPMMCSKIVTHKMLNSPLVKRVDKVFIKISNKYSSILDRAFVNKPVILLMAFVVIISCGFLYTGIKSELAPKEDQGFIGAIAIAPSSANLNYLKLYQEQLEKSVTENPELNNSLKTAFLVSGFPASNQAFMGLVFKPWNDRSIVASQGKNILTSNISDNPGIQAFSFEPPAIPGTSAMGTPIQFIIKSTSSYDKLAEIGDEFVSRLNESGMFVYANSSLKFDTPEIILDFNKSKMADLGLTMSNINNAFNSTFSGRYNSWFNMLGYSYKVIPELSDEFRSNTSDIKNIYIKLPAGGMIPLSAIMTIKYTSQPASLSSFQQLNDVQINAVQAPGISLGQAYDKVKSIASEILPDTMTTDTQGQLRQYVNEGNSMMIAFGFALIVIFLMLAAQFESFRDPLVILITVPMSICGALIPFYIFQIFQSPWASINIYSQVGLITLIGLISKHGILLTEFANKLQEEGMDKISAIKKSAKLRLRPILMTTAAMSFGVIPLMMTTGAGAESRHSIGFIIFFGMIIGTLFTIFVVPVVYSLIAKDRITMIKQNKLNDNDIKFINELNI